MASKKSTIKIDIPENRFSGEQISPSSPGPGSVPGQGFNSELPVVYKSVSAAVQNEIDRMNALEWPDLQQRLASTSGQLAEGQESIELINQLSIQRKQTRDSRRLTLTTPEKEEPSPFVPPEVAQIAPKKSILDRVPSAIQKMSMTKAPALDALIEAQADDHMISLDQLEKRLDTNVQTGLTESQVVQRRAKYGRNVLSPPKGTPTWIAFVKCLIGGFGVVLWIAFILCILSYEPLGEPSPDPYNLVLAAVILAVIVVQGMFFFVQERRSSNLMASFNNLLPTNCQVLREGNWKTVEAGDLVVGDVVRLKGGDKVPADMRMYEVYQAKVEKSSLTGESEPIPLSNSSADPNIYETRNVALFGTSMLEGSATGVVFNTADRTIMGKIAKVASATSTVTTSLQREINLFTGLVGLMALVLCIIVVAGYYGGVDPVHPHYMLLPAIITNCIAAVVALLPDGAPVALAMILTMVAKRMYTVKILVKKLTILETLGCATLIASDKTGTLTQNRMTLNHLWIASDSKGGLVAAEEMRKKDPGMEEKMFDEVERTSPGWFGVKNIGRNLADCSLHFLCQIMALCNKTVFEAREKSDLPDFVVNKSGTQRKLIGNPTEGALLLAANEYLDAETLRQMTPIVGEIAFSSRTKYHLTLHKISSKTLFQNTSYAIESTDGNASYNYIIFAKGAPEYILSSCTKAVVNGQEVDADNALISRIIQANELLGSHGERVLAFAYRKLYSKEYPTNFVFDMEDEDRWMDQLCFLGLAGIIDPPREGVAESITECHSAHVRVMMVTGDQPTTAVAIARAVNIITHKQVKTMADIQNEVPFSAEDEQDDQENDGRRKSRISKIFSKIKSIVKPPPKRRFRDESIVVAGNEIAQLGPKQWDFVLQHREVVFARTTPQQKLEIVKESRKRGDVVAVTGDGVNDAPALKAADLGVAMGICGSDVSKEAANMILLDDNFITIVNGIKEGRLLFDNLKKVICYLFPCGSFSEILPVLATVFIGMPMPLSTFLMIVICVGSDMIGSLGLIHEYAESDIMRRPPRNTRTDWLVNARTILHSYFFVGVMESTIAFFMYFFTMAHLGGVYPDKIVGAFNHWTNDTNWVPGKTPDELTELNSLAQTAFFVSLVMTQLWNLLAVRTRYQSIFTQKFQMKLIYFMLAEVAVVLCVVYLPAIQEFMHTRPVRWYHFFMPLGMGSIILVFDELRKFFVRKYPRGIVAKLAW